ncbi:thiamine phosphate synthase [Halomonas sp. MCCC 1A17488]|uniref:Thiamine-phosphate synthase n=1 Tax=Billgrantia sulfidoxydans TaxID=2733484 RepID=A0ABX7VYP0_9GAMM|nr:MULTISPECIES: thiamine phosphate synthase [Halomonas]MCE8016944.1 thiamine phosphate synthase [Halomonas sp. MCCC 1A17488]MCG3240277.1 thiamine phosphate synthase [Halomonas sp. MCCC 1A17488]QPP49849.1 thiamine phosphate synthase [Halomonas sp. SS10-MC5]QTP53469.1 thiamine phosphate synthase [Halomonas sulfidoxydans]
MPLDLSLYLVTDPELCARHGLVETVVAAVRGGVSVVQLRDKQASDGEMIDQARRLKAALAGSGVPLIINDRLAVAVESGADGLHIGQDDGDVAAARAALGENAILGLSVQNHDQLARLDPARLDYLGLGPVFATSTKRDHARPLGFDGLAALVAASPLPAVAIGGLKAKHARAVREAGARGPAVVSAICGQPDPEAAARAFFAD